MWKFIKISLSILGSLILIGILVVSFFWWNYRVFVDAERKSVPEHVKAAYPLASKVNPFIGTGGVSWMCAYNFPGVSLPFGMLRLSPETESMITNERAKNTSGYFYGDRKMIGFSHTRLVGTGAVDGGHFLIQPGTGASSDQYQEVKYKYSHQNELAYAGFYSIDFPDKGITVELTGTQRVGFHRYTFSETAAPNLLLDVTHALGDKRSEDGKLQILSDRKIAGHVRTFGSFAGRYGGIKVYFAAVFSSPFSDHVVWSDLLRIENAPEYSGDDLKAQFTFREPVVELKLAISHVSIQNAWQNLEEESGENSFETICAAATQTWENRLSSIKVTGGTSDQQTNFYTALYRSFQMPTVFNDVDGSYIGFDKEIHQTAEGSYFTDMSIWDTFRTTHPLYNLIDQESQHRMIVSLIDMAKQGGWLPRWPSGNGYTNSMLGSASDIVISEAYQKGICDYDVQFAYENMKKIAMNSTPRGAPYSGRDDNDLCVQYGYCPADTMKEAVSRTLEFAWSDYSISLLAGELGHHEEAKKFYDKSMLYKNVWNPETQFFHPKNANGEFTEHFKPHLLTYVESSGKYTNDYVEGNAMQWRWAPFFDAEGLINLFESREYFIEELNTFFEKANSKVGHWYPGHYYWHGNEPDIHAVYLFNYAGRADLTQKWVRWIMDTKYANRYDGLDGNDDGGTLSAWYVFSALGFYPVAGTDIYQVGSPLFDGALIDIGSAILEIEVENHAPGNVYVNQLFINDQKLDRTWFRHEEIADGGKLKFVMSSKPANR